MEAADRLFYQKGIRAVGVDTVAAEAGISKRSLYDTFPSKDALIAAYLRQRIQPLPAIRRTACRPGAGAVRPAPCTLRQRRLSRLSLRQRSHRTGRGLRNGPGDRVGLQGRAAPADRVPAGQSRCRQPDALASQIALLFEGAIASMLVRQDPAVAIQARDAATVLMRAAGTAIEAASPVRGGGVSRSETARHDGQAPPTDPCPGEPTRGKRSGLQGGKPGLLNGGRGRDRQTS